MKVYVVASRCLEGYEYYKDLSQTKVFQDKKQAEQAYLTRIDDLQYYFTEGNMWCETDELDDNTTIVTANDEHCDLCCCVTFEEIEVL